MGKGAGNCDERVGLLLGGPQAVTDDDGMTTITMDPEAMKGMDPDELKKQVAAAKKAKEEEAARLKKERDKLIAETIKEHGEQALHAINPLALKAELAGGTDTDDPDILLTPCVEVSMVVNPVFDAAMQKLGAMRRGKRTYVFQASKEAPSANLRGVLQAIPIASTYTADRWAKAKLGKNGGHSSNSEGAHVRSTVLETDLGNNIGYGVITDINKDSYFYPEEGTRHSAILMNRKINEVSFKVMTQKNKHNKATELYPNAPNLHQMREEGMTDPVQVPPHIAFSLIGEARRCKLGVIVDPRLEELTGQFDRSVIARTIPGSPGEAELILGKDVTGVTKANHTLVDMPGATGAKMVRLTAQEAGDLVIKAGKSKDDYLSMVDPQVQDVIRMEQAEIEEIDGLLSYQNEAVALHRATKIGYLNASAPGLGKTPMTLVGCKMKWEDKEREDQPYRAIIGGPKALTGQWLSESGRFFPGAQVFNLTTTNLGTLAKKLQEHDLKRPAYPLLVIGSYGAVKKAMPHLLSWRWDDVVIDEAAFLKGSSKQSAAFWQLRQQADCAVALTGTPIDKGLNDMGAILSWVRNDPSLFSGQKLDRFNITNKTDLANLWKAVGPVIFRRDRSEISDQLPKIKTEVLMYEPHKTEKDLADGARNQLKKILLEMEENIEKQIQAATKSKKNDDLEALEEAQNEIRSIRGSALAGVQLARMAASDPASLVESKSMAAALLDGAGLIEPAVKHGGTKRKEMVKYIEDKVEGKGAVLIFTDFVAVAEALEGELKDAGMRVGSFRGGQNNEKRDAAKASFQGTPCNTHRRKPGADKECSSCTQPELDVLVLGKSAKEGLNLQRADHLIHYDLSWTPSDFVQRIGRASRYGSDNDQLTVTIPLMQDTVEERVAAVLVPRAMKALMALDGSRGADIAKSELSGMSKEISEKLGSEHTGGEDASVFAMAKQIVLEDN